MRLPFDVEPGVDHRLNWRMRYALKVVTEAWMEVVGERWTMTSGADRAHGEWSWHYYDMAFDAGTADLDSQTAANVTARIKGSLRAPYQVVREFNHIHIECDLDAYPEFAGKHPKEGQL